MLRRGMRSHPFCRVRLSTLGFAAGNHEAGSVLTRGITLLCFAVTFLVMGVSTVIFVLMAFKAAHEKRQVSIGEKK